MFLTFLELKECKKNWIWPDQSPPIAKSNGNKKLVFVISVTDVTSVSSTMSSTFSYLLFAPFLATFWQSEKKSISKGESRTNKMTFLLY